MYYQKENGGKKDGKKRGNRDTGKTTCCYDRGWDCEPEDDATKAALAILVMEYN